jgi:hypothetical protein
MSSADFSSSSAEIGAENEAVAVKIRKQVQNENIECLTLLFNLHERSLFVKSRLRSTDFQRLKVGIDCPFWLSIWSWSWS